MSWKSPSTLYLSSAIPRHPSALKLARFEFSDDLCLAGPRSLPPRDLVSVASICGDDYPRSPHSFHARHSRATSEPQRLRQVLGLRIAPQPSSDIHDAPCQLPRVHGNGPKLHNRKSTNFTPLCAHNRAMPRINRQRRNADAPAQPSVMPRPPPPMNASRARPTRTPWRRNMDAVAVFMAASCQREGSRTTRAPLRSTSANANTLAQPPTQRWRDAAAPAVFTAATWRRERSHTM
ncbi:hypothetical protein B0H13DRAFT_2470520 [Mycena leptocephala]|nr:hypothetical protein B0H13DRAFT_2470520 [Mycena leptocephala]